MVTTRVFICLLFICSVAQASEQIHSPFVIVQTTEIRRSQVCNQNSCSFQDQPTGMLKVCNGVAISSDAKNGEFVLTVFHVLRNATTPQVVYGGTTFPTTVVSQDPQRDLLLLWVPNLDVNGIVVAEADPPSFAPITGHFWHWSRRGPPQFITKQAALTGRIHTIHGISRWVVNTPSVQGWSGGAWTYNNTLIGIQMTTTATESQIIVRESMFKFLNQAQGYSNEAEQPKQDSESTDPEIPDKRKTKPKKKNKPNVPQSADNDNNTNQPEGLSQVAADSEPSILSKTYDFASEYGWGLLGSFLFGTGGWVVARYIGSLAHKRVKRRIQERYLSPSTSYQESEVGCTSSQAPFPRYLDEARQLRELRQSEGRVAALDALVGMIFDDKVNEILETSDNDSEKTFARNLKNSIMDQVDRVAPIQTPQGN